MNKHDSVLTEREPCPNCGAPVRVAYGPDIRFNPPSGMMYRAECSGDCLNPSWTSFTRDSALEMWNNGVRRAAIEAHKKGMV